jgi:hypothetical protein
VVEGDGISQRPGVGDGTLRERLVCGDRLVSGNGLVRGGIASSGARELTIL